MSISPKISTLHIALSSSLLLAALPVTAQTPPVPRNGSPIPVAIDRGNERLSEDNISKNAQLPKQPAIKPAPATTLPSEAGEKGDIYFTPEELINNPQELEKLLVEAIRLNETEGLKVLLPLYAKVEKDRDDSLIDWGNAIIAMDEGRTEDAVALYRKLIANLPDNRLLRFQTALALYRNNEMIAAKEQLQKLRSADVSEADRKTLDEFITTIDRRDSWSFGGSLSYVHDNNVNNVSPKGTRMILRNGRSLESNREQEKANGVSYSIDVDKRWSLSDNYYSSLHGSVSGVYYFHKRNYNDITTQIAAGGGFRNARIDVEITPFVQKRFYGRGSNGDNKLHAYSNSGGLRVNSAYWIDPKWRLQTNAEFSYDKYVKTFDYLDGKRISLSNTLTFAPTQKQYWFAGLDLSHKGARSASDAYDRFSTRLGWGQEWGKGISTRLTGTYGKRFAKGEDFFNIDRKDSEYNANLSVWHRNVHFFGITPRLVFSYSKIDSNNRFYTYDSSKIYMDFSKSF